MFMSPHTISSGNKSLYCAAAASLAPLTRKVKCVMFSQPFHNVTLAGEHWDKVRDEGMLDSSGPNAFIFSCTKNINIFPQNSSHFGNTSQNYRNSHLLQVTWVLAKLHRSLWEVLEMLHDNHLLFKFEFKSHWKVNGFYFIPREHAIDKNKTSYPFIYSYTI